MTDTPKPNNDNTDLVWVDTEQQVGINGGHSLTKEKSMPDDRSDRIALREARMSPDGFVAQRFPEQNFNGQGHWILTFWTLEAGLTLQIFSDEQVADWPPLSLATH
jgi:hypothetical protein